MDNIYKILNECGCRYRTVVSDYEHKKLVFVVFRLPTDIPPIVNRLRLSPILLRPTTNVVPILAKSKSILYADLDNFECMFRFEYMNGRTIYSDEVFE